MAIDSWSLVRVFGTWVNHGGAMIAGKYTIRVPVRLTNSADDLIIPAGVFATGDLNVTPGVPSLSIECPATDDPDIQQDGWKLTVEVTFTPGQAKETYVIDVPMAARPVADGGTGAGVNLRTIALTANLPPQVAMYGVGRPLGLAVLSEDGTAVLDAFGDPISGGGGGSATWGAISGKPAVIAAGATQAEARDSIGAGISNLALGTTAGTAAAGNDARLSDQRTPSDNSVTNAKVAAAAGITLDKTVDSAASTGRLAMTNAERTKLAGIASAATANASDADLRDRTTHTGPQLAGVTVTGTPTAGQVVQASSPTAASWVTPSGSSPDATSGVKGVVQLAGDLGGTAAAPTVPGLAGKANTTHSHAASDLNSGTLDIARIPTGTTGTTVPLGNDARFTDARTPLAHSHATGDITGFAAAALAAAPAETTTSVGALVNSATAKATPVDADMLALADSAASNVVKKLTWANLKATLKTYLDTLYATVTHSHAAADISSGTLAIARIPTGTTSSTVAIGNDARLSDARTPVAHSAALVTSGNLDIARNTASIPHDVWQASGGTWPARPSVPSGARVNWIGYPGLADVPGALVTGTDSYTMRTA